MRHFIPDDYKLEECEDNNKNENYEENKNLSCIYENIDEEINEDNIEVEI